MPFNLVRNIALLLTLFVSSCFAKEVIRYEDNTSQIKSFAPYFIGLLKLAVEQSAEEYGEVEFVPIEVLMSDARKFVSLNSNLIDVSWTTYTSDHEQQALAVKIPLLKGMFGYRVLLIRKNEQAKFSSIKSINQLAELTALQGKGWSEVQLMRNAGLKVKTMDWTPKFYQLVSNGSVDYYPRSVMDIHNELANAKAENLAIEQTLLLKFRNNAYFFVAKDNTKLAKRLEYGLIKSIEDGSYEEYFMQHGNNAKALKMLNESRHVFDLD
ncbi:ABC transporter substrate-binding protein [Paraglaciecola sp. L3A3]|uniref:substrate-binding periplasmic protein n=1 Tax=Paraglaciecola sp. L3A3 TaxID=2686358 RepID=UPI00131C337B|nr:transporter substrate-binding domain-containing protein [Paraglaciecola sp. L3A3]